MRQISAAAGANISAAAGANIDFCNVCRFVTPAHGIRSPDCYGDFEVLRLLSQ